MICAVKALNFMKQGSCHPSLYYKIIMCLETKETIPHVTIVN